MNERLKILMARDWEKTFLWLALAVVMYENPRYREVVLIVGLMVAALLSIKIIVASEKK